MRSPSWSLCLLLAVLAGTGARAQAPDPARPNAPATAPGTAPTPAPATAPTTAPTTTASGATVPARAAGTATSGGTQDGKTPPPRTSADTWTESYSRRLFASCDADGDDRLDLFEAGSALETVGSAKDREAFRRLDHDRDGYISWLEFDQLFRTVVQRGETLRVHPCRPLAGEAPEQRQSGRATPAQQLMQLWDANKDRELDQAELTRLAQGVGLPPSFVTTLLAADRDHSGGLCEAELAAVLQQLPVGTPLLNVSTATTGNLPSPWGAIDLDHDGAIDVKELDLALRRIDPQLGRWAAVILREADKDKSGKLQAAELPGVAQPLPGGAQAMAGRPDPR